MRLCFATKSTLNGLHGLEIFPSLQKENIHKGTGHLTMLYTCARCSFFPTVYTAVCMHYLLANITLHMALYNGEKEIEIVELIVDTGNVTILLIDFQYQKEWTRI